MTDRLITPHGGSLVNLIADATRSGELTAASQEFQSLTLNQRQICDLELLMNGGFSPLRGFMKSAEVESVARTLRLPSGDIWPIPITLDVSREFADGLASDGGATPLVALRDLEGVMLAVLHVEEIFDNDRESESELVYGTTSLEHPGVKHLHHRTGDVLLGGRVEGLQLPTWYDYKQLRHTPERLRNDFERLGWRNTVAFQTRNPMHRAHFELTLRASRDLQANLLIHPVVGQTKPGDLDHYTRVRCYNQIMRHYPVNTAMLSLLPLAMRMAGPREAVWHAIIRKNYGCTHFIVGRDHAGPGSDSAGKPFYGPYEAQELLSEHQEELGVSMVPFQMMVYVNDRDTYEPIDSIEEGTRTSSISGTDLRERLARGTEVPEWFTFPEVAGELQLSHPPRSRQGFTVFFTGLSGSGKSTVANVLMVKLLEMGGRPVTLLDGDVVRTNLSSELGFSKEHRDINIRRIGYVASEITKNGGIAICAPIAPYEHVRGEVRDMIEPLGGFVLVHISTDIAVCEQRDRKGLYAKARAGLIGSFTGVSDPYEVPEDPEMRVDTAELSAEESAQEIILYLEKQGFVGRR